MTNNEKFEVIRNNFINNYNAHLAQLNKLNEQLLQAKSDNDIRKVNVFSHRVESINKNLNNLKNIIDNMRLNSEEDLNERLLIRENYGKLINDIVPDDIPLVFHGNNNIETVKQIIMSGGLLTPEERGEDFKSFATQIDVTAKSNISVSLDFADSSVNSFLPYGALFAFLPKEHEKDKVLKTGDSTEVFGGVESVRFDEDRFLGIITTNENINKLKKVMEDNHLDPNKVFTHDQFLEFCKSRVGIKNNTMDAVNDKYGSSEYIPKNINSLDITNLSCNQMEGLLFHFGWNKYLPLYDEKGIQSAIGENSDGIDPEKSIFFSKGVEGCLELWDVWLKWRLNRLNNPQYEGNTQEEINTNIKRYYNGNISDSERERWYNWLDYFNNKRFVDDDNTLNKLFDYQYSEMANSDYYILNLKENEEYVNDQTDIKKVWAIKNAKDNKRGINPTTLVQYGDYSDFSTPVCDKWNMQTIPGKDVVVEPNRIMRLSANGKNDVYSVVNCMYNKYKMEVDENKQTKFDVLDKYVDYVEKNKKQDDTKSQSKDNVVVKKRVKTKDSNGYASALIVTLITGFTGGMIATLIYMFMNK